MRDAHDKEILARAQGEAAQFSERRAGIIAHLVPLVGLEPNEQAYQDAVYRYDPPARRRALALHQSGCGLVMEYGFGKLAEAEADYRHALLIRPIGGPALPAGAKVDYLPI